MSKLSNKHNICYSLLYLLMLIRIFIALSFDIFFFHLIKIIYNHQNIILLIIEYKNAINSLLLRFYFYTLNYNFNELILYI